MKVLKRNYQGPMTIILTVSSFFILSFSQRTKAESTSCNFIFRSVKSYSADNAVIFQSIQKMMNNPKIHEPLIVEQIFQLSKTITDQQNILNNEIKYLDRLLSGFYQKSINGEISKDDRHRAEIDYQSAFRLQSANFRELVKIEQQHKSTTLLDSSLPLKHQLNQIQGEIHPTLVEIQKTQDIQVKIKLLSEFLSKNNQLSLLDFQVLLEKILPELEFNSKQANLILINALNKKFQVEWKNWENIGQLSLAYYLLLKVNVLKIEANNQSLDLDRTYKMLLTTMNRLTINAQASIAIKRNTEAENNDTLFKAQLKSLIADTLHNQLNSLANQSARRH